LEIRLYEKLAKVVLKNNNKELRKRTDIIEFIGEIVFRK